MDNNASEDEDKAYKQFPDLSKKLAAPTKQSVFERNKAEAEAKRRREEQETAAILDDFKKSFANEDESVAANTTEYRRASSGPGSLAPSNRAGFSGGPGRRHFTAAPQPKSGPGSLGPSPAVAPYKKRGWDGSRREDGNGDKETGIFGYDVEDNDEDRERAQENRHKRDADLKAERAASKPTLRLSSMPLGTSHAVIKSLLPSNLQVASVRILEPAAQRTGNTSERRSISAIIQFSTDTPGSDLDAAVTSLQGRYMGCGFYLSLQRHLSSAALNSSLQTSSNVLSAFSTNPFGAKPVPQSHQQLSRAPPPGGRGGRFAPPSSYGPSPNRQPELLQIAVVPPSNVNQLRLIHKTIESVERHGPEFEALLMTRPSVQQEEKWAWIWDARSQGGVYYRWRLWEILSRRRGVRKAPQRDQGFGLQRETVKLFDGGVNWVAPENALPFEYSIDFDELRDDSAYDSEEEEDSGDEMGMPRLRRDRVEQSGKVPDPSMLANIGEESSFLNPLQRAKLIHLLTRLPTTTGRLRRGDVARITAFAIVHSGAGAEEVSDMLISNIVHPVSLSKTANRDDDGHESIDGPSYDNASLEPGAEEQQRDKISSAMLIGLHLLSDILSASSTSGIHRSWRYRQLIHSALARHQVFGRLGRLDRDMKWGRMKSEKWKRSIGQILELWKEWCVFSTSELEALQKSFDEPPLTKEEEEEETRIAKEKRDLERERRRKAQELKDREKEEKERKREDERRARREKRKEEARKQASDEAKASDQDMKNADDGAGKGAEQGPAESQAKVLRRPKAEDMFADSDDNS